MVERLMRVVALVMGLVLNVTLGLGLLGLGTMAAHAASQGKVMMVLDGSGSMWGQVDGVSKIEIARTEIDRLLSTWSPEVDLGIMAYGHREKGNCGDIETVVPLQKVDRTRYMQAVRAISPKGKTPISAAVSRAADELKYTEEKATIVLVSDGLETCNADPCALAGELEAKGVDFKVHVIGFDLKPEERASLQCLADKTGGQFFSAGNAAELSGALTQAAEVIAAPVIVPDEAAGPQGLKLTAVLAPGEPALEKDVFYWVYESAADLEGNRKEVTRNGSAQPLIELGAGQYRVVASYGKARTSADLTVSPGELTEATLIFDAGHLQVTSIATEGAAPLEKDVFYWLYENETDLEGNRREVARNGSAKALFKVPAGTYHLVSRHGKAFASTTVTVAPAQLTTAVLDLNVGYVRASAVPVKGAPSLDKDVFYWLYASETDLNGKRKEIARNGSAAALFKVPAGTYRLVSRHGKAFAEQDVTVAANQLTEVTLDLNVGYVRATTVMAPDAPPLEKDIFYWAFQSETGLDGKRKEIDRNGSPTALFKLPAGAYVIQSRFGSANAYARETVTVTPGQMTEVTLNANAGTIVAQAVLEEGGAPIKDNSRVFWWVLAKDIDAQGRREEVARNGSARAVLNLAAGDYVLRVRVDERTVERAVTVTAGQVGTVQIPVN
ncbi:MAG: VWA domain-containing protein [Alphaproteobacteria bacterium]